MLEAYSSLFVTVPLTEDREHIYHLDVFIFSLQSSSSCMHHQLYLQCVHGKT